MNKWRYLVIGGATLSWAGCSDLPSFPENFGAGGGAGTSTTPGAGTGTVLPSGGSSNAGTSSTMNMSGAMAMTGGMAGSMAMAGGSAGSAGTGETGGSGGTGVNPQAEIDDAVKNLKAWRYENPCGYVDGHPLTDGTCNSGEICWPSAAKARFMESKQIAIGGTVGHQYDVKLRIRGAIEPRDYPQDCVRLPGAPANTIGVLENCDGFANQAAVSFNIFELKIQDPPHVYYLNGVTVHPPHRVDPIDQEFTVRVAGGSKIDFKFDDLNGGEIRNCSITVEGIVPYPKVFDGNFFQLDVLDAKLVP